jgi:TRAP-type C4-dicarboxylate transport system substrate-binding protein
MATLLCLLFYRSAQAEEVVVKLGTLAPPGSPWHILLKEAAQRWEQTTGGQVKLKVYAGGTMGNEGDMIKKIRIGQLQAAALTTIGLHEITPEPLALDLPLLVQSGPEKDFLIAKLAPRLEEALAKQGYVVLNWSEIGFVRFFTTKPRATLSQMRQGKLFVWEGDPASVDAWKAGGFSTVVLSATDIVSSMQTGMIDTVAYPPTVALGVRLHDKAKYMADLVWSSLTGALIMDKKTWDRIPGEHRPALMKISRELGQRTIETARKMEDESLTKMKAQGLQVVHVTDTAEWHKAVEATNGAIRGKVVPAPLFDEARRLVQEFRSQKAAR